MTIVNIDVKDLGGVAHPQDRVVFRAPNHRSDGEQVVSTALHTVMLVDGIGSTSLSPGPAVVRLHCQGVADTGEKSIMVPEEGPVALANLLQSTFTYTPAVVSQVTLEAQRAVDAAVRAEGVADAFGSLEGVEDQVQAASDAALSASGSAASASSSESAAATSESNAAGSATSADSSASAAASSASAAASSASAATEAAGNAAGSESQAASSASAAASSASVADSAATRAEAVADSTHWQDDRLSVMGQLGPPLTGPKGDKGDSGAGSGDVLWSELNLVLDGKASVSHDHTIGQVTGLQDELDGKAAAGHQHSWGDVTGKPDAYPPESHTHPQSEVEGLEAALDGKASTGHTHAEYAESSRVTALEGSQPIIVSSLPASPMPGRIYLVTG